MLPCPWDSPGKNTGAGCHFLPQCMKVKSESAVAQSCPTPSDPMDCSLPGSSVHGICQARILEWVAIAFSDPNIILQLKKNKNATKQHSCHREIVPERKSQSMCQTHDFLTLRNLHSHRNLQHHHPYCSEVTSIEAKPSTSKNIRTHWRLPLCLVIFLSIKYF